MLRFLATGDAPQVAGVVPPPAPHDYGVAVILNGLADRGVEVDAGRDLLAAPLPGHEQVRPPPGEPPVQLLEERQSRWGEDLGGARMI